MKPNTTFLSTKEYRIGKTVFLVTSYFKDESDITLTSKISRLIEAEAAKS